MERGNTLLLPNSKSSTQIKPTINNTYQMNQHQSIPTQQQWASNQARNTFTSQPAVQQINNRTASMMAGMSPQHSMYNNPQNFSPFGNNQVQATSGFNRNHSNISGVTSASRMAMRAEGIDDTNVNPYCTSPGNYVPNHFPFKGSIVRNKVIRHVSEGEPSEGGRELSEQSSDPEEIVDIERRIPTKMENFHYEPSPIESFQRLYPLESVHYNMTPPYNQSQVRTWVGLPIVYNADGTKLEPQLQTTTVSTETSNEVRKAVTSVDDSSFSGLISRDSDGNLKPVSSIRPREASLSTTNDNKVRTRVPRSRRPIDFQAALKTHYRSHSNEMLLLTHIEGVDSNKRINADVAKLNKRKLDSYAKQGNKKFVLVPVEGLTSSQSISA